MPVVLGRTETKKSGKPLAVMGITTLSKVKVKVESVPVVP